jgi:hypothetical protein
MLLVTTNVPSSRILVILMMEALRSSETSVLTRVTWRDNPEDDILHTRTFLLRSCPHKTCGPLLRRTDVHSQPSSQGFREDSSRCGTVDYGTIRSF